MDLNRNLIRRAVLQAIAVATTAPVLLRSGAAAAAEFPDKPIKV